MSLLPFRLPTYNSGWPREMSARESNIRRELAYLHLKGLGADITKPTVVDMVEMIYKSPKFRECTEKILRTPIEKIIDSLPKDGAGTRAKSFLKKRGISDVEGLVRDRPGVKAGTETESFGIRAALSETNECEPSRK